MRIYYEPVKRVTSDNSESTLHSRASRTALLGDHTFIFSLTLALAIGLLWLPLAIQFDHTVNDLFLGLAHDYFPKKITPEVAFVPIDDQSVDPNHSTNASLWDKDGWQTRRLWNQFFTDMDQLCKPKVIAVDILIRQNSKKSSNQPPDEQTIHQIEDSGNQEFLSELINYDDARSQGGSAPWVLFAFEFLDNQHAEERLMKEEIKEQAFWFSKLAPFALPDACVGRGSTAIVHRAVRLPIKEILSAPSYNLGAINVPPDPDLVFRRIPLIYAYQAPNNPKILYTPSFALQAFLLNQGLTVQDLHPPHTGLLPALDILPGDSLTLRTAQGQWTVPIDQNLCMTIFPRFTFPLDIPVKIPFVGVLDAAGEPRSAQELKELLQDKVIVVGEEFTGAPDVGNFPLQESVSRALIHLHVLNNLFQKDFLAESSVAARLLVCLMVGLLGALLHHLVQSRVALWLHALVIIVYPDFAAGMLIGGHLIIPFTAPMVLLITSLGLHTYSAYAQAHRQRLVMRRHFASVTSSRVLHLLEENPEAYNLSRKQEATMLFSDVEAFTSLSEKLDPDFLAGLINRYLTPMSQIIVKYDGYIDKYAGDGIMALWGVPLPDKNHAAQACRAAWYQLQAARALDERLPDGTSYKFRIRIGLNSGMVAAGNMGSALKQQYTVMGDEVNLAARLEPANKDYHSSIILGPLTYQQASKIIQVRKLDKIVVKGRKSAVLIYELLGLVEESPEPIAWALHYERGLTLLWERSWNEAEAAFRAAIAARAGGDPASEVQLERLALYRKQEPPPEWQGEHVRLKKD